ncbi:MAG: DUF1385 domain-containing protein [Anaerolineae bacterium]|nr:DUF1385 domain-containing protein [Anaerolineae bacterium]
MMRSRTSEPGEGGAPVQGKLDHEHRWMGLTWRFASREHCKKFAAAPERYAPQYTGYDALSVAGGALVEADPAVWTLHDDRLYLHRDRDAQAAWAADIPGNLARADAAWPALRAQVEAAPGEIVVHEDDLNPRIYRGALAKTPLLRGMIMLWDALGLGTRALMWSADVALGEDEDVSFSGPLGIGTMVVSLALGLGLFLLLPAAVAGGIENLLNIHSALVTNFVEGFIRLLLVIGYIWLIGRVPDIKRLFAYHGAEHKTINAYEAGADLTPQSVARFPLEHPRCGTGFLLVVVVVSVFVFAFLGHPDNLILRLGSRILLIPLVAGIAYEWIRFAAKHLDNALVRALIQPNLWLQKLTTREPGLDMLEVAICALQRVLVAEPNITPVVAEGAAAGAAESGAK